MITLKNLVKKYNPGMENEVVALGGINLEIKDGEMIAVMGPSGSGKSTLLNMVGLIDEPTEGEYLLDGENVGHLPDKKKAAIRNKQIGFVLQDFGLLMDRSAEENIIVPLLFSKEPISKSKKRVRPIMEQLGMVNNPKVILADEPTGALDSKTAEDVVDVFRTLNNSGTTIIVVTHNKAVADKCDTLYTIKDGLIV